MNISQLKAITEELQTQDNGGTADPIFIVMEKVKSSPVEAEYGYDCAEWIETEEGTTVELAEVAKAIGMDAADFDYPHSRYEFEEAAKEKGYMFYRYQLFNRAVNAHFTRKAAEEHLKLNGHNLRQPFIYTMSLFRCQEMIDLRNWLLSGEPAKIMEENAELKEQLERYKNYLDDACECARCCECTGMVEDCRIRAAKMAKLENESTERVPPAPSSAHLLDAMEEIDSMLGEIND